MTGPDLLRCTSLERELVREELYSGLASVTFIMNADGTWAAHIRDVSFEGVSVPGLLRELAEILEES